MTRKLCFIQCYSFSHFGGANTEASWLCYGLSLYFCVNCVLFLWICECLTYCVTMSSVMINLSFDLNWDVFSHRYYTVLLLWVYAGKENDTHKERWQNERTMKSTVAQHHRFAGPGKGKGLWRSSSGGIEEVHISKATLKCHIRLISHDHSVLWSVIFHWCWGVGLFLTLFPILKTRTLFLICLARMLYLPGNACRMIFWKML